MGSYAGQLIYVGVKMVVCDKVIQLIDEITANSIDGSSVCIDLEADGGPVHLDVKWPNRKLGNGTMGHGVHAEVGWP